MTRHRVVLCLASAIWAAVAARASAATQDGGARGPPADDPAGGPSFEEEVVVRAPARLADTWAPTGAGVQVLDARELQAAGARTVQEVLLRLPGAHLTDEQGNSLQQGLSIRGLAASPVTGLPQGVSVFVDGVRVNEPAAEEVNFDLLPLADVERIEVVRAPYAVFGRNTLAGAIHVITRRGDVRPSVEVEAEGGSALRQEVAARVSGPVGPLDGYLSLGQMSERGWREGAGARSGRAFGKLGFRGDDLDATLSYQFQLDRIEQSGSLPVSLLERDRSQNYTSGDFFRPRLHLVTLNARQRLAPGLSLAVNGFLRALDQDQFNSSFSSPDTRLAESTRSVGGAVQLDHHLVLGPLRSDLAVGAEVTRSSVELAVRQEQNAHVPPVSSDGLPLPRLTADLSDRQVSAGAFAQERLRAAAGPLAGLGLSASLRWDRISHDVLDASPDDPGKATGRLTYSGWVAGAGVSWDLGPGWLAWASWAQGLRLPAFLELACGDPTAPCVGLQFGVAPDTSLVALRPVRSQTYEVGVSGSPVAGLTVGVTLFQVGLQDEIYSVTAPGTTSVWFQNVGATRRQGAEVALHGERGPVSADLSYAYTLATFEDAFSLATPRLDQGIEEQVRPGNELPLTPRHRARLDARVRALAWLDLTAGATVVGSQWFRGDEVNVAPKVAGYAVLRAGVEARWRGFTAWLQATNLLDSRYETFGTWAPDGRFAGGAITPFLTPGSPLRLLGGVRWSLD